MLYSFNLFCCCGAVLVVSCVVLFLLCVSVCDLFLFLPESHSCLSDMIYPLRAVLLESNKIYIYYYIYNTYTYKYVYVALEPRPLE